MKRGTKRTLKIVLCIAIALCLTAFYYLLLYGIAFTGNDALFILTIISYPLALLVAPVLLFKSIQKNPSQLIGVIIGSVVIFPLLMWILLLA